jgi:excisionase family DNA binding protein
MTINNVEEDKITEISNDKLYTISEVAVTLNVSERTIRRYSKEQIFEHAMKIGKKRWLIPGYDVLEFCHPEETIVFDGLLPERNLERSQGELINEEYGEEGLG